jgi:hypothetical protein
MSNPTLFFWKCLFFIGPEVGLLIYLGRTGNPVYISAATLIFLIGIIGLAIEERLDEIIRLLRNTRTNSI